MEKNGIFLIIILLYGLSSAHTYAMDPAEYFKKELEKEEKKSKKKLEKKRQQQKHQDYFSQFAKNNVNLALPLSILTEKELDYLAMYLKHRK